MNLKHVLSKWGLDPLADGSVPSDANGVFVLVISCADLRGPESKSCNKVSVGEPVEGSLK